MSRRSPYPLRRCSASTTRSPSRRPGRDRDLELRRRDARPTPPRRAAASYALMRALPFACRARGAMRIHSSSRASVRRRVSSTFSSCASRSLLLLEPARVVALPRDAVAAVELEDPARDVVEEVAVVGDRDDGAVVLVQVALEPRDRLGVEVVGGLVEQQQVGLREQQPAQRDAAPLATRELRARRRRRAAAAARPSRSRAVRSRSQPFDRVDLVLELRLLGEQLVEVGVGLAHRRRRPPRTGRGGPWCAPTPSVTFPSTSLAGSSCGLLRAGSRR